MDANQANEAIDTTADPVMDAVRKAITELRYGFISLTVHDAKVVQIEVTEKHRF